MSEKVTLSCDCGADTVISEGNYMKWVEDNSLTPPFECEGCSKHNIELTETSIDDIISLNPEVHPFLGKMSYLISKLNKTEDQGEKYRTFREMFTDMKNNLRYVKLMGPSFVYSASNNINNFMKDGEFSKDETIKENGAKLYEEFSEFLLA